MLENSLNDFHVILRKVDKPNMWTFNIDMLITFYFYFKFKATINHWIFDKGFGLKSINRCFSFSKTVGAPIIIEYINQSHV